MRHFILHNKSLALAFVLTFIQISLYGQSLKGTVVDARNNPLLGVQILDLSTNLHSHTDINGQFILLHVNIGDSVTIYNFGFESKLIIINNLLESLDIVLKEKSVSLEQVTISPKADALNIIAGYDSRTTPVNSSQDLLRQVPGLFIGQHAGGGKAEQIFLRSFDNDHGTDIAINVDGVPVNMVSHAHGQGYSDLHFVIPETVEKVGYGKGPYYANQGNFNTSGYVSLNTKDQIEQSSIKLEAGQFNTQRVMGMFKINGSEKSHGYIASEFLGTDGPFDSPQNFNRINLFGKYTAKVNTDDIIGIQFSHFTSKWDASGQIPQRAVDSGMIGRFGSIDDTEGGNTSRTNVALDYKKTLDDQSFIQNKIYYSNYDFELYSNFTFFLNDPINGDQIKQKEDRNLIGFQSEYARSFSKGDFQVGISLRNDQTIDSELSHTLNRTTVLEAIQLGDISETNLGAYANLNFDLGYWRINPSVRVDYFDFQYNDKISSSYKTEAQEKAILSPKLNLIYHKNENMQFYFKAGKGFHSNDTRVVVAQKGNQILPAAYGSDLGLIWKPVPKVLVNAAYWYLYMQQEFVYVGDEGVVEPSGKSQRQGVDLSLRYQPLDWLYWNMDATYAHGRFVDEEPGQDYIPLALNLTLTSSLTVIHPSGYYGAINMRHISNRPANEDNSIVAKGYTLLDMNVGYKWKDFNLGFTILNLLNTAWNETQFATTTRLLGEREAVDEITFTPGTPFNGKLTIEYRF